VFGSLACVFGVWLITLGIARVFTKVECASLDQVVIIRGFSAGVFVVRGVPGRLHEASFRRTERHVGSWRALRRVGSVQCSNKLRCIASQHL